MLNFVYKKIFHINLGSYVAAFLCFFAAYAENKKDNIYKNIYENGTNVNSTIVEKTRLCGKTKGHRWFKTKIESTSEICTLETSQEICANKFVGDTILVRYVPGLSKCTVAKFNIGKYGNDNKWFCFFALLLGFGFLISDFIANRKKERRNSYN